MPTNPPKVAAKAAAADAAIDALAQPAAAAKAAPAAGAKAAGAKAEAKAAKPKKEKRKRKPRLPGAGNRSTSASGYFGVGLNRKRYQAWIKIQGTKKTKQLGTFDTAEAAAAEYDKAAMEAGKPHSKLNFPKNAPKGYVPVQQKSQKNNTSGYRGVYKTGKLTGDQQQYRAMIRIDGVLGHLGTYQSAKDAAIAYDRAVHSSDQPTSWLNFPNEKIMDQPEPARKKYKLSTTGYRGVTLHGKKYKAQIFIEKKNKALGYFATAKEAAAAYDAAILKHNKPHHKLNFSQQEAV